MNVKRNIRRRRGFTLIEALIIVTIVSILLPVILYCISLSQDAANLVVRRNKAMEIAYNQMNTAMVDATWQSGDTSGDENDGIDYHWVTHAQDWADANERELHVDVTWNDGSRTRQVSLVTLVYNVPVTQ